MFTSPALGLLHFLQSVPDPRGRHGLRHSHTAMLAVVVCATLCGFHSYDAIAQWIHLQPVEFWHRLGFNRRPPTSGGFRHLMKMLDAQALERALLRWITEDLGVSLEQEDLQVLSSMEKFYAVPKHATPEPSP